MTEGRIIGTTSSERKTWDLILQIVEVIERLYDLKECRNRRVLLYFSYNSLRRKRRYGSFLVMVILNRTIFLVRDNSRSMSLDGYLLKIYKNLYIVRL